MPNYFPLFLCGWLFLLTTLPAVWARHPWHCCGGPFIAFADSEPTTTSTEDSSPPRDEEAEVPLQSESVPLPKVEDDKNSPWSFKTRKRSFDEVRLPTNHPRRKRGRPKTQASAQQRKRAGTSGTRFDLRAPSAERITQWFAPCEERKKAKSAAQPFNHDSVGMTNPMLGVGASGTTPDNRYDAASLASSSSTSGIHEYELEDSWIIPSSTSTTTLSSAAATRVLQYKQKPPSDADNVEKAWFPPTNHNRHDKQKWRRCCFRRRVGQGRACYEKVREAALEWKFQHEQHPQKGILTVGAAAGGAGISRQSPSCFSLAESASQQVYPVWSGPHSTGSRRLVTYTTTGFKSKCLPKLYTFNPVMVVYDFLDQRGPATTYTSTAYATLRGHLLSGEERVTVALRDGTGFVDVEILSFSRPAASIQGRLVWPLIGRMQQRFFEHQMDYLERVAMPNPR